LLGVSALMDLLASPFAGTVWETLVCAELRRQLRFGVRPGQLFYFRDRTKEVDFVIHRGGRFELYEAKWTEQPDAADARSIQKVSHELGQRSIARSGVVCRVSNPRPLEAGAQALPLAHV
jgi:predicted AAA+ superfamily ATPase